MISKKKLIILCAICVGIAIYSFIINPDNGFNMLPYAFFIMFNNNANRGGESGFIIVFDALFSMGLAYCLYYFLKEMTE
jgi:hypothetical protein